MPKTNRTRKPVASTDLFLGQYEAISLGDRIGFVDGPGQDPEDNAGLVVEKYENGWGRQLVVEMADGSRKTASSLTTIGIGAYRLPPVGAKFAGTVAAVRKP